MGRITLMGFYAYDSTLFSDIVLPIGIDKTILLDTILAESGDLYTYYQQPTYLKRNINNWFYTMKPQFERMVNALNEEYNALHNFDRHELYTDTSSGTNNFTDTKEQSATNNIENNSSATGTREDKRSAYNSSSYSPDNSSDNESSVNSLQEASAEANEDIRHNGTTSNNVRHEGHLYGNIGVTTSQAMLQAELELRKYDLYLEIAKMFEHKFLVQVY